MNRMKKSLALVLLASALVGCLCFSACTKAGKDPQGKPPEKEGTMLKRKATPEVLEANKEIIKEHLDEIGFTEKYRSHEGTARGVSGDFGYSRGTKIVKVSSEQTKSGGVILTLTDEEGEVYTTGVSIIGSAGDIYDSKGNVVFANIM